MALGGFNLIDLLLAQQDPLGEQAGMPTMGPPGMPPPGMPGGMSGPPASRAGGGQPQGFGEKLTGALNSPLGVLGMNLLAQSGPSLQPQSFAGNVGMAGLRTMNQLNAQQKMALDRQLIESRIGLNKAQTLGLENMGAANPVSSLPSGVLEKFDPNSIVAAIQSGDLNQLRAAGPDADKVQARVNELADDIRAESKEFNAQKDAFGRIQASAADPSAAGDLALIFNYMKVLDPGSTVREGEFANAQNSGSVPNRIRALYNSVLEGTRLSDPQRRDFVNRAGRLFNSAVKGQKERNARFRQRGLNAEIPEAFLTPILPGAELVEVTPFDPNSLSPDERVTSPENQAEYADEI